MKFRKIDVRKGKNRYRMKAEDGTLIGEVEIYYDPQAKTCMVDISKKGATMERVSITNR